MLPASRRSLPRRWDGTGPASLAELRVAQQGRARSGGCPRFCAPRRLPPPGSAARGEGRIPGRVELCTGPVLFVCFFIFSVFSLSGAFVSLFSFGASLRQVPPCCKAPPGALPAAVEAALVTVACRLPRAELRPTPRGKRGQPTFPPGAAGKQRGRDVEQAGELPPPRFYLRRLGFAPVLGGRSPAGAGGARRVPGGAWPALAGAAGVGLGAGGSCGEESGTGARGRKEGIRRTWCELRQLGEADAHCASPVLGTRSQ